MEQAIRIIASDHEELVSITQMLELGEGETRNGNYECHVESCRVPVIPIIPQAHKEGRKFAPRPHFRANQTTPHLPGCLYYAGDQVDDDEIATDKGKTVRTTSDAVLPNYPVRFDERASSVDGTGGDGGADDGGITNVRGGRSTGEGGGRQHTSERTSGLVSVLVRVYEATSAAEHTQMPLEIPGCPARNYEGVFKPVRRAVGRQGRHGPPHIYYGRYGSHRVYNSGGISIIFAALAADGKPFSVWVEAGLGSTTVRQALLESLGQAQAGAVAVVYVLGGFRLHRRYKYTVEITGLNRVHVSLQSNQQP